MAELSRNEPFLPLEFDGLKLPEMGEVESGLRAMPLSFDALKAHAGGGVEALKQLQGSFALRVVDDLVANYVVDTATTMVPMDAATCGRVEQAVRSKEWAGVAADSAEKFVLRELIARSTRLKLQLIREWLDTAENTGLTPVGELEYKHVMPALAANDRMFIAMMTEVPPIDSAERLERGMTHELSIVREFGGVVREVPFHEAYPEETDVITAAYADLLAALGRLRKECVENERMIALIDRKLEYYVTVLEAFLESDMDKIRKADALLPQQLVDGSDVAHYHHIETGYMRDRVLRAPGIALRTPDLNETNAQERSAETKETMLRSMQDARLADLPAVEATRALLENSNAVLRHFLGSGFEIDLKPSGQILPNEFESRAEGGVDSSLDMDSARRRHPLALQAFRDVFGDEVFGRFYSGETDYDEAIGGGVASHELGHAVGLVEGTRERLGESVLINPYIEEWKATVAGIVLNYYIPFLNGEVDYSMLEGLVVGQIRTLCRYAMGRSQLHTAAYFRHSQMLVKVAEDCGIVHPSGDAWDIDLDRTKVLDYFGRVFQQFREVMGIYWEGSADDLNAYLEENLQATPFVDFVCERISVPDAEQFTPAQLAKLPHQLAAEKAALVDRVPQQLSDIQKGVTAVMDEVEA